MFTTSEHPLSPTPHNMWCVLMCSHRVCGVWSAYRVVCAALVLLFFWFRGQSMPIFCLQFPSCLVYDSCWLYTHCHLLSRHFTHFHRMRLLVKIFSQAFLCAICTYFPTGNRGVGRQRISLHDFSVFAGDMHVCL